MGFVQIESPRGVCPKNFWVPRVTRERLRSALTPGSSLVSHGHLAPLCLDLTQRAVRCGAAALEKTNAAPVVLSRHGLCR